MKDAFLATARMLRLNLRRKRVMIAIFVVIPSLFMAATLASTIAMFPTSESLVEMEASLNDPIVIAMHGKVQDISVQGYACWRTKVTISLVAACFSTVIVAACTREDEQTGRRDLLTANVSGRQAPLLAALLTALVANALMASMLLAVMLALGCGVLGSIAHCGALFLGGCFFSAATALFAQFFSQARAARNASFGVLLIGFVAHLFWNMRGARDGLIWLNALDWPYLVRPFAEERFGILWIALAMVAGCVGAAFALERGRDVGAGYLHPRNGRSHAKPSFRSVFALSWRQQRGMLLVWLLSVLSLGFAMGMASRTMANYTATAPALVAFAERLGGADRAFMALMVYIFAQLFAVYGIMALQKLRAEEKEGKLDTLLALPNRRSIAMGGHVLYMFAGSVCILLAMGIGIGAGAALSTGVASEFSRVLVDCVAKLPALWVMLGCFALLYGLWPRISVALSLACVAFTLFAELMWEQRVLSAAAFRALSPFASVYPTGNVGGLTVVLLLAVGTLLAACGFLAFQRRNII